MGITERESIFKRFDRDHTGDIDMNEFCQVLDATHPHALLSVEASIRKLGDRVKATYGYYSWSDMFNVFDANRDGTLTRDEWRRAMRTIGPDVSEADINDVFNRFDFDRSGYIDLTEFQGFFQEAIERGGPVSYSTGISPRGVGVGGATYGTIPPTYVPPHE